MEIRHSPIPLHTPPAPVQPPARTSAQQELLPTNRAEQEGRGSGLTEYIARGELVEEGEGTDYRDLIRAARQQRAEAVQNQPGAAADAPSPYAARALQAYQSNTETPAAANQRQGFDQLV